MAPPRFQFSNPVDWLTKWISALTKAPDRSSTALCTPAPGDLRIVATATPPGYVSRSKSIICLRRGMMNPMPNTPPAMQANTMRTTLKSVSPRMNNAGTVNIMPADAPFTALAIVWLMLFSTMLVRPIRPRRMPNPRMAASSDPSMEKPSMSAAYPMLRAIRIPSP